MLQKKITNTKEKEETKKVRKTRKKKVTEKKEVTVCPYSDFIQTYIYKEIRDNLDKITEICKKDECKKEMSLGSWKFFNKIIIDISKLATDYDKDKIVSNHFHLEPLQRVKYTITQLVREIERRTYILNLASNVKEDTEENRDQNIHNCYLIYQHIAIFIEENSK